MSFPGGRAGLRLALLGIGAYLVFLIASLPAAWLGLALERASGGALALGETRGTAWSGAGALALRSGGVFRRVADLDWRCNPFFLFAGRLKFALSAAAPQAQGRATASFGAGEVSLRDVEATLPATLVEAAFPAAAFARPDGELRVRTEAFEVGKAYARGAATVEWANASLRGLAPRLGDYRLQIDASGDRAELKLATLRGDLRLDGQGEWLAAQPKSLHLRGIAEAAAGRRDLEPLLRLLGSGGTGMIQPFTLKVPLG